MKKWTMLLAISSVLVTPSAFASEATCKEFATDMTKHVVNIFHDGSKTEVAKRQMLSTVFTEAVDTDWIGKFVLGRFWQTASAEERTQYLKSYRAYITQNYISKFNDEDAMAVEDIVVSQLVAQDSGQFEAKTIIKRKGDEDVGVEYLLDDASGKCLVHDIKVEGVSLLATQRSEFSALASSSGVKGVIDAMQKKLTNKPIN